MSAYRGDVDKVFISESAPLGVSELESLDDTMIGKGFANRVRDIGWAEPVP